MFNEVGQVMGEGQQAGPITAHGSTHVIDLAYFRATCHTFKPSYWLLEWVKGSRVMYAHNIQIIFFPPSIAKMATD
jgi:hypothetical protein